jgi:hypothetical protein
MVEVARMGVVVVFVLVRIWTRLLVLKAITHLHAALLLPQAILIVHHRHAQGISCQPCWYRNVTLDIISYREERSDR